MESLTKNKQDGDVIQKMVHKFFPKDIMADCIELKEGFFNVAYEIGFENRKPVILKIAPKTDARIMASEKNIMQSEIYALKVVDQVEGIPAPKLLAQDDSGLICPAPYFFMEKLDGESLNSVKDKLTAKEIDDIYVRIGEINRKINEIICPCFGYPAQPEYQGKEWYFVFLKMLEAGIKDADAGNVNLNISIDGLHNKMVRDREIFLEVKEPRLVHWDCWDGNIFVQNGKVTGLIDWERCLWADPLMEVGFRTYDIKPGFIKGYGISQLTEIQRQRAIWYDIYLMILGSLECEYRKYETDDMYKWANGILQEQYEKLR